MNNDRTDQELRDRNVTEGMHQGQRGTPTMQRSRTERGEIEGNQEIDDDAMIDEATRSEIGAGE